MAEYKQTWSYKARRKVESIYRHHFEEAPLADMDIPVIEHARTIKEWIPGLFYDFKSLVIEFAMPNENDWVEIVFRAHEPDCYMRVWFEDNKDEYMLLTWERPDDGDNEIYLLEITAQCMDVRTSSFRVMNSIDYIDILPSAEILAKRDPGMAYAIDIAVLSAKARIITRIRQKMNQVAQVTQSRTVNPRDDGIHRFSGTDIAADLLLHLGPAQNDSQ